jgi:hypothetical protein
MCHKPKEYIEAHEIALKPELELDAPYLCLCPECATKYDSLRFDETKIKQFIDKICNLCVNDISGDAPIEVCVGNEQIWFAHTHIAEIRELYLLQRDEIKGKTEDKPTLATDEQFLPLNVITAGHKNFGKPAQEKVDSLIDYYKKNGKLDKPIVVSKCGDKYLIEDKYLRFYVATLLGLKSVPVTIVPPKRNSTSKNLQTDAKKKARVCQVGETLKGKKIIISFGKDQEIIGIVQDDKLGTLSLKQENVNADNAVEKFQIAPNLRTKYIRVIE